MKCEQAKAQQIESVRRALQWAEKNLEVETYDRVTALIQAREEISRAIMFLRKPQ